MDNRILYVGGLDDEVDEKILHAAFIPFGDIVSVNLPKDPSSDKHRGFGFVEFEEGEDAEEAIDNMHHAELYGRVLRVNTAQGNTVTANSSRPIWSEDSYLKEHVAVPDVRAPDDTKQEPAKRTRTEN